MGYICIFDCETIPDSASLSQTFGYSGSDLEIAKQALAAQLQATNSEFLPVCFHKIIAISTVLADNFGNFLKISTVQGENEREKIAKFLKFIDKYNPRLVSFNGRGFDLPMIMIRAMKYNLSAAAYFCTDDKELMKDKWKNYRSRFDGVFHLDLLDHISDFRSVSGLKLDHLCSSLNLPGKYDVHGDQVLNLFYEDKLDRICEYCESDALNTYWLFLKYELLKAHITLPDYAKFIAQMDSYLKANKSSINYTEVFCKYIQEELERVKFEL